MHDAHDYADGEFYSDYDYNVATLQQSTLTPPTSTALTSGSLENRQAHHLNGGLHSEQYTGPVIYNSYAGADIVATMVLPNNEPVNMGELQTISYSTHRENNPVRVLGHSSPISFVKGGRTIAGSMIFTVFNNYAFYRLQHFQEAIAFGIYPIADMLPPIDIVLTFANEFGVFSKMKLWGVTFVDEGGSMSIDDLITESTFSYMARGIQPLTGWVPSERA